MNNLTLLATRGGNTPDPTLPDWLNGDWLVGLIMGVAAILCLFGALALLPKAHKKRTGEVASGLVNYVIIIGFIVLVAGGVIFAITSGTLNQLTSSK